MDLEAREIPIQSRAMYNSRLKSYKQEVEKLEKDFVSTFKHYCRTSFNNGLNSIHILEPVYFTFFYFTFTHTPDINAVLTYSVSPTKVKSLYLKQCFY